MQSNFSYHVVWQFGLVMYGLESGYDTPFGDVAHMVERPLRMREAQSSILCISIFAPMVLFWLSSVRIRARLLQLGFAPIWSFFCFRASETRTAPQCVFWLS